MKLEIKDVTFRYKKDGAEILNNFSLSLSSNERVGIFAPSGFGKTTLCKIIAGYLKPEKGEVFLDSKPLSSYKGYCPVQLIWQNPELALNPRLPMKYAIAEGDNVEEGIAEKLGIEKSWMERFPGELSGGEMQRFCIARVLGERTKFILADEITTMMDPISRSQIWNFLIEETQKRDIGLIAVSHNRPLLDKICTRQIDLTEIAK